MKSEIQKAQKDNLPKILEHLRRRGVQNAYAIQDLTVWFETSEFFYVLRDDGLSYVLKTGHPAAGRLTTLIAEGEPEAVATILHEMNVPAPCLIRETSAHLLPVIKNQYPDARVYHEQRMDVTKKSFIPQHQGLAHRLTVEHAVAVAQFFGAPPQAAERFHGWLSGSKAFYGVLQGDRLASMGSAMIAIPEAWNLVSIATHKDFRGKGFATEVTSALVAHALKETDTVTLTVLKDNIPALRTYEKIGFKYQQDRVWVDNGADSAP